MSNENYLLFCFLAFIFFSFAFETFCIRKKLKELKESLDAVNESRMNLLKDWLAHINDSAWLDYCNSKMKIDREHTSDNKETTRF